MVPSSPQTKSCIDVAASSRGADRTDLEGISEESAIAGRREGVIGRRMEVSPVREKLSIIFILVEERSNMRSESPGNSSREKKRLQAEAPKRGLPGSLRDCPMQN